MAVSAVKEVSNPVAETEKKQRAPRGEGKKIVRNLNTHVRITDADGNDITNSVTVEVLNATFDSCAALLFSDKNHGAKLLRFKV